jgi:hypothetical protein
MSSSVAGILDTADALADLLRALIRAFVQTIRLPRVA